MRTLSPLLLLLAACSETGVTSVPTSNGANASLLVEPLLLDFGRVPFGAEAAQDVRVTNAGTAVLRVASMSLSASPGFSIPDVSLPFELEPGDTRTVTVDYRGGEYAGLGWLDIMSNDDRSPEQTVEIVADALISSFDASDLLVSDLTACIEQREVRVSVPNRGDDTLYIDDVVSLGPDVTVLGFSHATPPGESAEIALIVQSLDGVARPNPIEVTSNSPRSPQTFSVYTQVNDAVDLAGFSDPLHVTLMPGDAMEVPLTVDLPDPNRPKDLTILVDSTGSMSGTLNALTATFSTIAAHLAHSYPSLTVGLATYRDYPVAGRGAPEDRPFTLLQQQTTDAALVQSKLPTLRAAGGGDGPESGLEAILQAIHGAGVDLGCNGFGVRDVPPFRAHPGDTFGGTAAGSEQINTPGTGTLGGMGYRASADAIIVIATDANMHDADVNSSLPGCDPAGFQAVVAAATATGTKVAGVAVHGQASATLDRLARATGAADSDGAPIRMSWTPGDGTDVFQEGLIALIEEAARQEPLFADADDPYELVNSWSPITEDESIATVTATLRNTVPQLLCEQHLPVRVWLEGGVSEAHEEEIVVVVPAL